MSGKRDLIALEFVSKEGYRLGYDADGWRLIKPRQLSHTELADAQALLDRAETLVMPVEPDKPAPTMKQHGEFVATTLKLRINHYRFNHSRS